MQFEHTSYFAALEGTAVRLQLRGALIALVVAPGWLPVLVPPTLVPRPPAAR
jgi:hypothetical protein